MLEDHRKPGQGCESEGKGQWLLQDGVARAFSGWTPCVNYVLFILLYFKVLNKYEK